MSQTKRLAPYSSSICNLWKKNTYWKSPQKSGTCFFLKTGNHPWIEFFHLCVPSLQLLLESRTLKLTSPMWNILTPLYEVSQVKDLVWRHNCVFVLLLGALIEVVNFLESSCLSGFMSRYFVSLLSVPSVNSKSSWVTTAMVCELQIFTFHNCNGLC